MIQPNCRTQFAAEDIDFILSVLGHKIETADCLVKLLADLLAENAAGLHVLVDDVVLAERLRRSGRPVSPGSRTSTCICVRALR